MLHKLDIMHRFSTGKTYLLSEENMPGKLDIFSTEKTYLLSEENMLDKSRFVRTAMVYTEMFCSTVSRVLDSIFLTVLREY